MIDFYGSKLAQAKPEDKNKPWVQLTRMNLNALRYSLSCLQQMTDVDKAVAYTEITHAQPTHPAS